MKNVVILVLLLIVGAFATLVMQDTLGLKLGYRVVLKQEPRVTLGEAVDAAIPHAVYLSEGEQERSAGKAYPVDCTDAKRSKAQGFVRGKLAPGQTTDLIKSGTLDGFSGLIPGAVYYASPTQPGQITSERPEIPGTSVVALGVALSQTALELTPKAAETPILAPQTSSEEAQDSSQQVLTSLESFIADMTQSCAAGVRNRCLLLGELRGNTRSPSFLHSVLERRCLSHTDNENCIALGQLALSGESKQSQLNNALRACQDGTESSCFIAYGVLLAQRKTQDLVKLIHQVCDRGLWELCGEGAPKLQDEVIRKAAQRCSKKSAKDCLLVGLAKESKDFFSAACRLGEPWGCFVLGSVEQNMGLLARIETECQSGKPLACMQVAGNKFAHFDYSGAKRILDFSCGKGSKPACDFISSHSGVWNQ